MLKLNKQQIKALAEQITSELNSEEIKEQKIKKWLNSEQSLEYKENVRPLFKKVKKKYYQVILLLIMFILIIKIQI